MPSSSNKRPRHSSGGSSSSSSRGRGPSTPGSTSSVASASSQDSAFRLQQMFSYYKDSVINMVLEDIQAQTQGTENALPCPFQRRNPTRYRHVKDPACNGRGFKDIADLRDHIKRAHSSRYGCHYCKERFQGRDNAVEDAYRTHKKKCKWYAERREAEVSRGKPEVMSPEQDKLYFQLDFRRSKGYSAGDKQYVQYWDICKAIWPEYASREKFETLDLRNKACAIEVSRLSEIMENAFSTVDINQFVMTQYASSPSRGSPSSSSSSHEASPRSSFAVVSPHHRSSSHCQSPSRALFSDSPRYDDDNDGAPEDEHCTADGEPAPQQQYNALLQMYAVPQPVRYAERTGLRDSAYGSMSQVDGCAAGHGQQSSSSSNCWQHGNTRLGEQMLTDGGGGGDDCDEGGGGGGGIGHMLSDEECGMDMMLDTAGAVGRDFAALTPPGSYQCWGAGLEDDLMMVGGAAGCLGDEFYTS